MSTSAATPDEEEQRLIDFRNATNFRSVKRADPHVSSILETSVYSVVYYYDETSGKWEKQKQEGPLFVVRREKNPEYSLYMLNRQTVKNPAIPLVKGEMKLTVVDQGMLQVARRGDKLRIGIWFSEGEEAVNRFRSVILGICGEPSKRPDATASPAISSPPPNPSAGAEDGLSKLFAGLLTSPPVQAAVPSPQSTFTSVTTNALSTPSSQPILAASPAHPVLAPAPSEISTSAMTSPPQPPPPAPVLPTGPPGQTADDLLMSILGFNPPSQPQQPHQPHQQFLSPQPPFQQQYQPQQQYQSGPSIPNQAGPNFPVQQAPPLLPQQSFPQFHPSTQQSPSTSPQPPPQPPIQNYPPSPLRHQPIYAHKVGDATFAQAARTPPFAPPTISPAPHLAMHAGDSSFQSAPSHCRTPVNGYRPGVESRQTVTEAVIDGVDKKQRDEGLIIGGIGLGADERKKEFTRRLTDLILTDERFVDDLWFAYLERMSRAGSGG
ncbi:hypothetical protein CI109_106036 [Kwoniella shandongensis]|uniref:mRNA-decapping enzyme C-terminal domain-containing protein n=1 Tax=Kwoniella shandongensis TaxID=1734106 RepID=A0AAJ8MZB9_9TREE